ncbi:NifB/NifX family molybdenum-iron cluster-binding protein [Seleniivibrio woodruffii]|uniref:Putative Fe-Mo cluster-binding NifX family protein n=1 Tax=Seleniivibrio woodruffii TaxID=1078050 RepID=A0A4R1K704_9BACT|nr:NifB/NifX family molybdenum-iron cluster-binding protein [Seleniivibrio woodruffii]TCK60036.1 putative Fe-Mo cluster-binding NifX family protein [Seleniivibrio woodruffii]TVZ35743.1 putative Fe-Mo cluster-binding NifX family protein [Seleniivibrio woodruffii]
MKICFPVEEDGGLDSPIYGHFGSAPGFVTFDTDTQRTGFINNRNAVHEHGACNPAAALAGAGVDAVIVGGIGHGAMLRLMDGGVSVYQAKDGAVKMDAENFMQNRLTKLGGNENLCGGGTHSCGH